MMLAYAKEELILGIEHVSLTLGGRPILRDVSAEIRNIERPDLVQGQVVCFLGASGIGKTRLSRLIAGLDQPTSGSVLLADGQPVRQGVVGMVPQHYPLFEFATVRENLRIAGRQVELSAAGTDQKARPLIDAFGLEPYVSLYPAQLSGGTRQRVAIVRQLICSEHLIVLDEPFSGLDLVMKRRACDVINTIAQLHTLNTIIVVTHDVSEGMSVADTVWLMGLERDAAGVSVPGAKIIEQYDLAAAGLCWRADISTDPKFLEAVAQVKAKFLALAPGPRLEARS